MTYRGTENARLRAALKPFADLLYGLSNTLWETQNFLRLWTENISY